MPPVPPSKYAHDDSYEIALGDPAVCFSKLTVSRIQNNGLYGEKKVNYVEIGVGHLGFMLIRIS